MGPLVIPTMAYMPMYIGKHLVAARLAEQVGGTI